MGYRLIKILEVKMKYATMTFGPMSTIIFNDVFLQANSGLVGVKIYTNFITRKFLFSFASQDLDTEYIPEYKNTCREIKIVNNIGFLEISGLSKKYNWVRKEFEAQNTYKLIPYNTQDSLYWKQGIQISIK